MNKAMTAIEFEHLYEDTLESLESQGYELHANIIKRDKSSFYIGLLNNFKVPTDANGDIDWFKFC